MTKWKLRLGSLLLLSTSVYAQTDEKSITVTAVRSDTSWSARHADQVVFLVNVAAPSNTTIDDVIAALAGSGITRADLASVYSSQSAPSPAVPDCAGDVQWTFTLTAPLSKMSDTLALLTRIQQQVKQKISGSAMNFYINALQVSPELSDSQCAASDLLSDARREAQKLATAMGASVGPVLGLTDGYSSYGGIQSAFAPGPYLGLPPGPAACSSFTGSTGSGTGAGTGNGSAFASSTVFSPAIAQGNAVCSMTVKFSLIRP